MNYNYHPAVFIVLRPGASQWSRVFRRSLNQDRKREALLAWAVTPHPAIWESLFDH
jgi:hypothetical protein